MAYAKQSDYSQIGTQDLPRIGGNLFVESSRSTILITGNSALKLTEYAETLEIQRDFLNHIHKKANLANEYIYSFRIEMKSDNRSRIWKINRRFSDIVDAYKRIEKEMNLLKINFEPPNIELINPKTFKKEKNPKTRLGELVSFLKSLTLIRPFRIYSKWLYVLFEVSQLPLSTENKCSKEGFLLKKAGGRFRESRLRTYCGLLCNRWLKRWFFINDEGLYYALDSTSTELREVLIFDRSFKLIYGRKETGTKLGIIVFTSTRKLYLKASNIFEAIEWISSIQEAVKFCPYVSINRYYSFAPVRSPYSLYVYDELIKATKEVYLTGWWISPELHLKRPASHDNLQYRLDKVLETIAKKGVMINIILYREVRFALSNDSAYTKHALQALSPNIRVIRHPKEFLFLWSHHEKLVIIDQTVAFLGGLDLCYGRWDNNKHTLHDPASMQGSNTQTFPGIDYSNSRISDFRNVRVYEHSLIERNAIPRLPWHDIAMKVIGEPVKDITRHFTQSWNFAQLELKGKKNQFITASKSKPKEKEKEKEREKEREREKIENESKWNMVTPTKLLRLKNKMLSYLKSGNSPQEPQRQSSIDEEGFNQYLNSKTQFNQHANEKKAPRKEEVYQETENAKLFQRFDLETIEEHKTLEDLRTLDILRESTASKNLFLAESFVYKIDPCWKDYHKLPSNTYPRPSGDDQPPALRKLTQITQGDPNSQKPSRNPSLASKEPLRLMTNEDEEFILGTPDVKSPKYSAMIDKKYDDEYINLLRNARKKETYLENTASAKKKESFSHKLMKKFTTFQEKELEEKVESEEINDEFFEEVMLKPMMTGQEELANGTCQCQVLRSASSWTIGLNMGSEFLENSIQHAYVELIQSSKKFIYIENQFFISSTAGTPVYNEIAQALVLRIEKAYQLEENFRIMIFLPLLPAFEGEIDDSKSSVLRIQLHWLYQTIIRGQSSIINQLKQKGIEEPEKYIQFYSLRQHGKLNNKPATELIYIHSKLMIIDDNVVIMGSANINDRSMQGSRDSEIAVITEDKDLVEAVMDGSNVFVGRFAHTLRVELLMEHLGFEKEQVIDPLNPELIEKMNSMAKRNTEIYRELFGCYPDDNIKSINEVQELKKQAKPENYDTLSPEIKGHVVQFPLHFLENENLTFSFVNKEYYIPDISFT